MPIKVVATHLKTTDGSQSIISGYFDTATREVFFATNITNDIAQRATLIGARMDFGEGNPPMFVSQTSKGYVADSAELHHAKFLVEDGGFEVVKDTETDYYRWRARFSTEESGLFDTDDEAYLGCVEQNGLDLE